MLPTISFKFTDIFAMHAVTLEVVYASENCEVSLTFTSSKSTSLVQYRDYKLNVRPICSASDEMLKTKGKKRVTCP